MPDITSLCCIDQGIFLLIVWISPSVSYIDTRQVSLQLERKTLSAVLGRDSVSEINNMLFSGFPYKKMSYLHGNALLTTDWI